MKKLLIISYAFPPQRNPESILVAKLVGGLMKQERVSVLPMVICAERKTVLEGTDNSLSSLIPHHCIVKRLPSIEGRFLPKVLSLLFPFLKKLPDKSVWWVFANKKRILPVCEKYQADALYSHSHYLGSHLLALQVKKKTGLPWIVHFSDPWTGNPYLPYGLLTKSINRKWEREVLRHADRIIFVSEQLQAFVMQSYPPSWKKKCRVIPHPYTPSLYRKTQQKKKKAPVMLSYVGNFYGKRNFYPFLSALSIIKKEHPEVYAQLKVRCIGHIPKRHTMHPLFKKHASHLQHIPPVPYLKSIAYMQASDILLLIDADMQPAVFLPSKLIDYLGTGKPILGITPKNNPADVLLQSLRNPCLQPNQTRKIATACLQLFSAVKQHRRRYTYSPAKTHAYHIDTVAKQVVQELQSLE